MARASGICFTCQPVSFDETDPTINGFIDSVSTCQIDDTTVNNSVPDGTYVVAGKYFDVGAEAHVGGYCEYWGFSGPNCVLLGTYLRNIYHVLAREEAPHGARNRLIVSETQNVQDLDTRIPGSTNGPWRVSPIILSLGTYTYRWVTNVASTPCEITPTQSPEVSQVVHAVACRPAWRLAGNPVVVPHLPAGAVTLGIPQAMMSDFEAIATDVASFWATHLQGIVSVSLAPGGCTVDDGTCVNIIDDFTATPSACASLDGGTLNLTSGAYSSNPTIHMPTNWRDRAANRNRRTLAHELGHTLGLDHNNCNPNYSVMAVMSGTNPCNATTGFTDEPALTDVLPTTKSTYGTYPRRVCGI
jgi:hypothetical protein